MKEFLLRMLSKISELTQDYGGMWMRWLVYVSIAVLTEITSQTETSTETSVDFFSDETSLTIKATLQGLIATRAFLDETAAWTSINRKEKKKKQEEALNDSK